MIIFIGQKLALILDYYPFDLDIFLSSVEVMQYFIVLREALIGME